MCYDVPKIVRSPGCDHGHDEESRNGRDIKIDILEAYIWTSESLRVKSAFYRSTRRLPEHPRGLLGLHGPRGRRGKEAGGGRMPLPFLVRIGQGKGAPPFPSPLPPLSPILLFQLGKKGVLLPVGVRLPPWRALLGRPPPSPGSFIYGGRGHPMTHKLNFVIVP